MTQISSPTLFPHAQFNPKLLLPYKKFMNSFLPLNARNLFMSINKQNFCSKIKKNRKMKGKYLWSSGNVWRAENAFDDRRGFFPRPTSVAEISVRDTNFITDLAWVRMWLRLIRHEIFMIAHRLEETNFLACEIFRGLFQIQRTTLLIKMFALGAYKSLERLNAERKNCVKIKLLNMYLR